jgi:hypothetical protein
MINFTPKQLEALKSAAEKSKKIQARADLGSAIDLGGQVVSAVIDGVYAIQNAKERQRFADLIQELNEQEASALADSLQRTNDNNEKIRTMTMFFATLYSDRAKRNISSNISNSILGKTSEDTKMIYIALGGIVVLLGIILIVKKLKK